MSASENATNVQTKSRSPPSENLLKWIKNHETASVLILDGGVSTHLENMLSLHNQCFSSRQLWSSSLLLDQLDSFILECHNDFAIAGADILSTVTYQCHFGAPNHLAAVVDDGKMTSMIIQGIQLARTCTTCYVAVSLGPYGAALADGSEYTGHYNGITRSSLLEFHRRRMIIATNQNPDAIAFETVPSFEEVSVLTELSKQNFTNDVAVWISLSCSKGCLLSDGTQIEKVLDEINRIDPNGDFVHAIGYNCFHGMYTSSLIEKLTHHMATKGPRRAIVIYPNSGEDWDAHESCWRKGAGSTGPNEFATELYSAISLVEKIWSEYSDLPRPKLILGGCCRTSPATIAALRELVDNPP
jgi:homocysteine S-methyltransferase